MNVTSRLTSGMLSLLAVAFLGLTVQTTAMAQASDGQPGNMRQGARATAFGAGLGGLGAALRQLDLSDAQKQSVRSIVSEARQQAAAQRQQDAPDPAALANPADPNHANAVEAAKRRAVARIQQMSDLQQRVYAVLTPAQQAKLPQVLADLRQKRAERRGARN
jgi:Spy/CpxP family protein refolding chaperone